MYKKMARYSAVNHNIEGGLKYICYRLYVSRFSDRAFTAQKAI